jgi:DNA-binding NarL/FixJ family response regulator
MRCVIIDDCERFLFAAQRVLERHGIDVVCAATNGTDGFARVRELRPDVVLVDLRLGEERGLALAERIAECADHSPVVILMSACSPDEVKPMINEDTIAAFLAKPKLTGQAIRDIVYRAGPEGL